MVSLNSSSSPAQLEMCANVFLPEGLRLGLHFKAKMFHWQEVIVCYPQSQREKVLVHYPPFIFSEKNR